MYSEKFIRSFPYFSSQNEVVGVAASQIVAAWAACQPTVEVGVVASTWVVDHPLPSEGVALQDLGLPEGVVEAASCYDVQV